MGELWHSQFTMSLGDNVDWEVYKEAIVKRFGSVFDDPMAELKNAKYVGWMLVKNMPLVCIGGLGLPVELEMSVRMLKPKTLSDAYSTPIERTSFDNHWNTHN